MRVEELIDYLQSLDPWMRQFGVVCIEREPGDDPVLEPLEVPQADDQLGRLIL